MKMTNSMRQEFREEARAILYSVTTVKRLQEVWPETEPYLPSANKPPVAVGKVQKLMKEVPKG